MTIPVTGISPAGIAVGDYNTDGRDDMAVVNSGSGTVSILLANADGSFAPQVDYAVNTGAVDASMGDLNGDSKLDLVVVFFLGSRRPLGKMGMELLEQLVHSPPR